MELPVAPMIRVVKSALPPGCSLNKDAKAAFSRAGAIFAVLLAST
jgi:hypothetical protein